MTASPAALTPTVLVGGQIEVSDIAKLFDQGVRVIVNHRPDGEAPDQIASLLLANEAAAHGVRFIHAPVAGMPSPEAIQATATALASLADGERALVFCKSGMRSAATWALAERDRGVDADTLRRQAADAGYDLSRLPL